jgi:hypothetical protein
VRRQPIRILTTTCRRCGRPVATADRSITGADAAKRQYDRICQGCTTPEEERAMLAAQAGAILAELDGVDPFA